MNPSQLRDLSRLIRRIGSPGKTAPEGLPRLQLTITEEPTLSFSQVCEPVFALVAQGRSRVTLGQRTFECGAGEYLVVPVDLPLNAYVTEASAGAPFMGLGLKLEPAAIAALMLDAPAGFPGTESEPGVTVSPLTEELLDSVTRLLRVAEQPRDLPVLAPVLERELLWRLLTGRQGALLRQIGLADGRLTQVSRAIRWIRSHYERKLRVEDLARIAGMSVTSFHRHFLRVTSLTPVQFQKQIRLHAARARLSAGAMSAAEVGYSVGYESASQFSREYRRLFGRPPGADGQVLRLGGVQR